MNPLLKDWIQVIAWGVAIIGGLVAAFVALFQFSASNEQRKRDNEQRKRDNEQRKRDNEQRKRELRWQQANAGKGLLDELFADPQAKDALRMLDFTCEEFTQIPGNDRKVSFGDIRKALKVQDLGDGSITYPNADAKSIFIRDRFDGLFFFLERCQYFIENGLVEFKDINVPLEYYVRIIVKRFESEFDSYGRSIRFGRALKFVHDLHASHLKSSIAPNPKLPD